MANTKTTKAIYWVTTGFIFLFEGVLPALTGHTEFAKAGIRHLGYPEYFGSMLVIFKVLGCIALIIPVTPKRLKEWAYAGLGFVMISACISYIAVDGFVGLAFFPLVVLGILLISYIYYNKMSKANRRVQALYPSAATPALS